MRSIVATMAAALVAAGLPACKSGGPRQARTFESPEGPVKIHPVLEERVGLPETYQPRTTHTQDGRLRFEFHLQNETEKQILVSIRPVFYDESGIIVENRGPTTEFLQPHSVQPMPPVTSSSRKAKTVQVMVAPAD